MERDDLLKMTSADKKGLSPHKTKMTADVVPEVQRLAIGLMCSSLGPTASRVHRVLHVA